eukprot:5314665-Alexandrium_andersonii.AAC.1
MGQAEAEVCSDGALDERALAAGSTSGRRPRTCAGHVPDAQMGAHATGGRLAGDLSLIHISEPTRLALI